MGLLRNVLGSMKDGASITKATVLSHTAQSARLSLRLSVLHATTHDPSSLPSARHLSSLLSLSSSAPRSTAYAAIDALISRLRRTRSAPVALKCLLVLHSVVRRGSFILHDQLSLLHGCRNHLNLSGFRDPSSLADWDLSTCVRWYARYLELILTASRALGHFLFSLSCRLERESAAENIPSLLNSDLLLEIDALLDVLEEMAKFPSNLNPNGESKLVTEVVRLVAEDYSVVVDDLASRIAEFNQRLSFLSFGDSVELMCELKRVENCREKLSGFFPLTAKAPAVRLWQLARRLREEVETVSESMEERAVVSRTRVGETGRSARLVDRVLEPPGDLVRFLSIRNGLL